MIVKRLREIDTNYQRYYAHRKNTLRKKRINLSVLSSATEIGISNLSAYLRGRKHPNPRNTMRIIIALAPSKKIAYKIFSEAGYNLACESVYTGFNADWGEYRRIINLLDTYHQIVVGFDNADLSKRSSLIVEARNLRDEIFNDSKELLEDGVDTLFGCWLF